MFSLILVLVSSSFFAAGSVAVIETYEFSSPELQQRYRQMSAELRCPKCQNQNIADSNAPIAQDLRRILYEQLESGSSDSEILDFMVSRYGEFVRYSPSFSGATAVLWLAPVILFLLAGLIVFISLGRRRGLADQPPPELSEQEQQRLQTLLNKAERDN
ncbi:MAG: cytochrome c-type biogenesis protein [Halioglobus sp.]